MSLDSEKHATHNYRKWPTRRAIMTDMKPFTAIVLMGLLAAAVLIAYTLACNWASVCS